MTTIWLRDNKWKVLSDGVSSCVPCDLASLIGLALHVLYIQILLLISNQYYRNYKV